MKAILTDDKISAIENALRSAAMRWKEYSESLCNRQVCEQFARQSAEATELADLFSQADQIIIKGIAS